MLAPLHAPDAEGPGPTDAMAAGVSRLSYASGTRFAREATLTFHGHSGEQHELVMRPRYTFYMNGLGYGHPEWGHGRYHGELAVGRDHMTLDDVSAAEPGNFHIQALCDVEKRSPEGVEHGCGVLEQLVIGPYAPYGFKDMVDLAP